MRTIPANRITPNQITCLKENEIFVFGSNMAGIHAGGAARLARSWGAEMGEAFGLFGKTYAIPTKRANIIEQLPIEEIAVYVDLFIECAIGHPYLTFLVTEIGCGLAHFTPQQIAPLFEKAIELENVHLPLRFWGVLTIKS